MSDSAPPEDFNASVIAEFRANHGTVAAFGDAQLVILHTIGAKSGAERLNPLMPLRHEGRLFVFASKAGAPSDPDWFRNLVANPTVTVETADDTYSATAVVLDPVERARIYAVQAEQTPQFAEYEKATTRTIPVVELVRT